MKWKWTVTGVILTSINIAMVYSHAGYHPPVPMPPPSAGPTILETQETWRCNRATPYRTFDGTCNNFNFPTWGRAKGPYQRLLPPDYANGIDAPRASKSGLPLPTTRRVSVGINFDRPIDSPRVTNLFAIFGQFFNHDITLKLEEPALDGRTLNVPDCCYSNGIPNPDPACAPILIGPDDPHFAQFGVKCMSVIRSKEFRTNRINYRENVNNNTAFIDGSMLYGSDTLTASSFRQYNKGMVQQTLRHSGKPLLPLKGTDVNICPSITGTCFRTGDFRANIDVPLSVLHTMLMREHNRIALELFYMNLHWGDERTFLETRRIIGAIIQHIAYNEYIPLILGPDYMTAFDLNLIKDGYYNGYDTLTNPNIINSFAAAAYRFGHSAINERYKRYDSNHNELSSLTPPFYKDLREPKVLFDGQLEIIAIGMANQRAREVDQHFTEQISNLMFANSSILGSGMDLFAMNIQRGRDNGIPSYTEWRKYCRLGTVNSFNDLRGIMPNEVVNAFTRLYTDVHDIDLYPAGLAEFQVPGGIVGPTFACIIAQQFKVLRKGDRFWYENGGQEGSFSPAQLAEIRKASLARIYCDNFDAVKTIQLRPMEVLQGARVRCSDPSLKSINLMAWQESRSAPQPIV